MKGISCKMRIDIHTSYRFKCMLSWLYIFAIMPLISVVLFIFSKWLIAALLILIYFFIGVIAFCIGNRISKQLLYQYIILDNEYFEIEDKYGNYLKFEKKVLYIAKEDPISLIFDVLSYAKGFSDNRSFVDGDFSIENGFEKIECYISYKSYKTLNRLEYKYIYR